MKSRIVLLILDPGDTFTTIPEGLSETLASIEKLRGSFELILVFNSPVSLAPNTFRFLKDYEVNHKNCLLIQQEEKQGISVGLNTGAFRETSEYDVLIMMSGDALIVDYDMLLNFESVFSKYSRIGCLHPISIFEDAPNLCNFSADYTMEKFHAHLKKGNAHCLEAEAHVASNIPFFIKEVKNRKREAFYPLPTLPLTFFAVRWPLYRSLNGFDEDFTCGHENNDFILRALRAGYYSAVHNRSFIYHRRLLFRVLGQAGNNRSLYNALAGQSGRVWKEKYGEKDNLTAFYEVRFGSFFANHLLPSAMFLRTHLKKILKNSNLLKIHQNRS
jgi:GT2 family glycosyltransferase